MQNLKNFVIKHMAFIVLIIAIVSLLIPKTTIWIETSWITYLLIVVMFGMGLTIKPNDFILILKKPKEVLAGIIGQYTLMPLIAFCLCYLFKLDEALTVGVILVGTCPGGTSSNVITYFSKGDIALSVCMTSINTLLAPVLTPIITYLLLKTTVDVDILSMFLTIVYVILIPISLGFIINRFFSNFTKKAIEILPIISVIAICMIIASVVSHNAQKIYVSGFLILCVVILHNFLGYLSGFLIGKLLKMNPEKIKAFSIEIGMQNSGLATSIANTTFSALHTATVPGAVFSVWHNISGAILASFYRKWNSKEKDKLT